MENYVASIKLSKQLVKAGYSAATFHRHHETVVVGASRLVAGDYKNLFIGGKPTRSYPAPMTDELIAALPLTIDHKGVDYELVVGADPEGHPVAQYEADEQRCLHRVASERLPDALALLLLWTISEGLCRGV